MNGETINNLAHLHTLYMQACAVQQKDKKKKAKASDAEKWRFLSFLFGDETRIVLETAGCISAEDEVLQQHGIPTAASSGTLKKK